MSRQVISLRATWAIGLALILCLTSAVLATGLEPVADWCGDLQAPTRIACDRAAHLVYVTSPRSGEIGVYNESGVLQNTITTVAHPSAITVDGSGNLFVTDNAVVRKLAVDGTITLTIGEDPARFVGPHDVAVAANGRLFVADACDSIKAFDAAGTYLFAFGGHGAASARLDDPVSLAINNSANEIYVSDQNNHRVNVYNLNGGYLRSWGVLGNGNYAAGGFLRPWGLAVDSLGRVWVYDDILNTAQVFQAGGTNVANIHINNSQLSTGVDIDIDGDLVLFSAQTSKCVLAYRMTESSQNAISSITSLDLTIAPTDEGVVLRWKKIPGASSYRVRGSDNFEFSPADVQELAMVTDTLYADNTAPSRQNKRFYQVSAILPGNPDMPDLEDLAGRNSLDDYHDSPHTIDAGVNCSSCHFAQFNYPNPITARWLSDQLCKTCHIETGKAEVAQNHFSSTDSVYCDVCHDPHSQQSQYPHNFVRTAIVTPHSGIRAVSFNSETDFVHGSPNYDGICEVCHTTTSYYRNNSSGNHSHNAGTNCTTCHKHLSGFQPTGGSCSSCHEAPPQTPAHIAHVGNPAAGIGYGDLRKTADFGSTETAYNFGCGNCHPADPSHHNNGVVEVELYNSSVAAGTLKSMNPATAHYTPGPNRFTDIRGFGYTDGTCSNVYCHSSGGAAQYRTYATANWGRSTPYGCGDCHQEPPRYDSHSIGGAGANSHYQFGLFWGFEDVGHVQGIHWYHDATTEADSSSTVMNCNTCHYATTSSNQNVGLNEGQADCGQCHTAQTVPPMGNRGVITNMANHVSGSVEITFPPTTFRSAAQLSVAPLGWTRHGSHDETVLANTSTYDPTTKTCSNVACHLDQTQVQWGYWGTDFNAGCECHNMSRSTARNIPQHSGESLRSQSCTSCHSNLHGSTPSGNSRR